MNLLIPMNISQASLNACEYALERFPDAVITILHSVSELLFAQLPYMEESEGTQDLKIRKILEHKILDRLKMADLPKRINIEIYYGEPVNVVSTYIKDNDFDAVVIGSRDNYNLFDKMIGTTALGIVKRSTIPVYVIPHNNSYRIYKKIVVASDEHITGHDIISAIDQWNESHAQIKFLHITEGKNKFVDTKEKLVKKLFEDLKPSYFYEVEEVIGNDVAESLLVNAQEYRADLLIVIARNKSFIHSLIFKSVSKELIMNSSMPMLFLHPNEN